MKSKKRSTPSVRRDQRALLDVYVNKIVGDEPHMARVRDISTSGLYLYKLLEPARGSEPDSHVGLEIMLPGSKNVIWAVGQVVREENGPARRGVAVRFTRIAEADRELIRSYVEARSDVGSDAHSQAA